MGYRYPHNLQINIKPADNSLILRWIIDLRIIIWTGDNWLICCWFNSSIYMISIKLNTFSTDVSLLYPLEASENLWFSYVFIGNRSATLVENGLSNDFRIRNSILPACLEHANLFCKKQCMLLLNSPTC